MTKAQIRFREAVLRCLQKRIYPSCNAITREIDGHTRPGRSLSGKECKWREEVFKENGWHRPEKPQNKNRPWEPTDKAYKPSGNVSTSCSTGYTSEAHELKLCNCVSRSQ